MPGWIRPAGACALLIVASTSLAGCKQEEPKDPAAVQAEVSAKLAKADLADGKEDKVVSKCGACDLGMDGSADHALTVSGYTLHFCSAGCRSHFEEDTSNAIVAMKVPQ